MARPLRLKLICALCGASSAHPLKAARCFACLAKKRRDHRHKNKAQNAAVFRAWCAKNKDKVKASARRNYLRHRERFIRDAVKWAKAHPKQRSVTMIFQNAKRRSRLEANGGRGFTKAQWRAIKTKCGELCIYCRDRRANSIDHFVPLTRGGVHDFANIVPACRLCNCRKNNQEPRAWVVKHFGQERLDFIDGMLLP